MTTSQTLLVTGASGHVGRKALEWLLETNTGPLIATTRTPETLQDLAEQGVAIRHADFDDPVSLVEAFRGADRLLLISTDALGVPGKRRTQHLNAVNAAQQAGVRHVVYTSFGKPRADSTFAVLADHYATEQALADSTLGWTVLRNNLYMESLVDTLKRALAQGQLTNAIGEGRVGYVTRQDCTRAAAAALTAPFNGQRMLEITGPTAPTQNELAVLLSELVGKPIPYVPVTAETLIDRMEQAGTPRPIATMMAGFETGMAQGEFESVTNNVEMLTGTPATHVSDYLAGQKGAFLSVA